jgi:hypothetical protein
MNRNLRQRIWKVEKLLSKAEELASLARIGREKRPRSQLEMIARAPPPPEIRDHAIAVAAIVLCGEPKIDEPLVHAWTRTLAHHRMDVQDQDATLNENELQVTKKMYPAIVEEPDYGTPRWNPYIVHTREAARFTEIFSTAPVWLLQFTNIELDAWLLKFDLPDISAELMWGVEGVKDSKRWPLLPLGTMAAGDPVRSALKGFEGDLSPEERRFYQETGRRVVSP